jgi:hypothetical protein
LSSCTTIFCTADLPVQPSAGALGRRSRLRVESKQPFSCSSLLSDCAYSRAGALGGRHCGFVGCQPSLRLSLQSLRASSRLSSSRRLSSGTV